MSANWPYPLSVLEDEYTKSQRKQVTFRKLYKNRSLSLSQLDRLKTAEALFECVPVSVYSPFIVFFLRATARANTGRRFVVLLGQLLVVVPPVEYFAMTYRDKLYWPIVREVYLELKQSEEERTKPVALSFARMALPTPETLSSLI